PTRRTAAHPRRARPPRRSSPAIRKEPPMKIERVHERDRRRLALQEVEVSQAPPPPEPLRPLTNSATGVVDRERLELVLPALREAEARSVLDAVARYDDATSVRLPGPEARLGPVENHDRIIAGQRAYAAVVAAGWHLRDAFLDDWRPILTYLAKRRLI